MKNLKIDKELENNIHSGKLYDCADDKLILIQQKYLDKVRKYNKIPHTKFGFYRRAKMLKKMFNEIGENCYIEAPFNSNWGGKNVHFGSNIYCNYNLSLVDDTHIFVGDYTMIAPNVTICTATHPINPQLRVQNLEYNLPVHIGKRCWIGAGVIIMPGVTIGDNTVIGAGSVVTKDIPSNVVAYGSPCKVHREINEFDKQFYDHDKPIPDEIKKYFN